MKSSILPRILLGLLCFLAGCADSIRYAGAPSGPRPYSPADASGIVILGFGQTAPGLTLFGNCPANHEVEWVRFTGSSGDGPDRILSKEIGCPDSKNGLIGYTVVQVPPGGYLLSTTTRTEQRGTYRTRYQGTGGRLGSEGMFAVRPGEVIYVGDAIFGMTEAYTPRIGGVLRNDAAARQVVAAHFGAVAAARMRFVDGYTASIPRLPADWRPAVLR